MLMLKKIYLLTDISRHNSVYDSVIRLSLITNLNYAPELQLAEKCRVDLH